MCTACLEEYDAVSALPPTEEMFAVADLIRALYRQPDGAAGGPLHVVVDDYNLLAEFLGPYAYEDVPRRTLELSIAICDGLRPMTLAERAATVGLAHGDLFF